MVIKIKNFTKIDTKIGKEKKLIQFLFCEHDYFIISLNFLYQYFKMVFKEDYIFMGVNLASYIHGGIIYLASYFCGILYIFI